MADYSSNSTNDQVNNTIPGSTSKNISKRSTFDLLPEYLQTDTNKKFLNATLDKSSEDNEKNIISIKKNNSDLIIVSQIAGLIARRIVCYLKTNDELVQGDRLGIIKFGSRVDLYLPLKYSPLVSVGQTVIGGETIISNLNKITKISKTEFK